MPAISRRAHEAKELMVGTMLDLMEKKVGERIEMNFDNLEKPIVWERVQ